MYTALERNRLYRIGKGDEARVLLYLNRDFPPDHPAVFNFRDTESGELITFMIEQLTILEREGGLEYVGVFIGKEKDHA